MAVAKGITNCQSEREITATGFKDLLNVVQNAKDINESNIKAKLYDIITNPFDSPEEKDCQKQPFENALSEQEESDIRIRRVILIGIFAFWEISLKEICSFYKIPIIKNRGKKEETTNTKNNSNKKVKEPLYISRDYINAIYDNNIPENVKIIDSGIKQLRNFMTHGSANKDRFRIIKTLAENHPEFGIKIEDSICLSSYDGLAKMTELIETTLTSTEKYTIEKMKRVSTPNSD